MPGSGSTALKKFGRCRASRLALTASDIPALGPLPTPGVLAGVDIKVPEYPILAKDVVRHVGDAIAFVVADSLEQAKDAAEALAVDWQELPHVVGAVAALKPGAPKVWADRPNNLAFETEVGDAHATKEAFAKAARVVELTIVNQRLVTNYLDTRGVVAEFDGDRYTLTLGSQGSHVIRDIIGGAVMKLPPEKMRVVTPDVGGGFGTKLFPYREYALAAVAAERSRRPVKWICDRSEHFLGDSHGRDNISTARLAVDEKGRFLALELDIIADMGAYLSCYAPYIPWLGVGMATGAYDIPVAHIRLRAAYTNTVPVDAYRGAGRPEASYLIERVVDAAAHDLDIAPDVLRRKNLIKPKALPYTTPTGKVYDSGDFAGTLARAQELGDWDGFNKRAAQSRRAGRLRGIGIATYIEACGNNGPETATLTLDRDGGVTLADRFAVDRPGPRHILCAADCRAARLAARARARRFRATLIASRAAPAPGGRAPFPSGAFLSIARRRHSQGRSRKSPRTRSKHRQATWRLRTGRCALPAPIASFHLPNSPRIQARRRRNCARRKSSALSRRLIPTALISPKLKSIPKPARRSSSITLLSTTSEPRSIRCCLPARCMAVLCRA